MRRSILVLVGLGWAAQAGAFNYFVDYVNGNNVANGQGQTPCSTAGCNGPWKTPPGASCVGDAQLQCLTDFDTGGTAYTNAMFLDGDTISIATGQNHQWVWWVRNDHFVTTATTGILIGTYVPPGGTSTDPIIEGGDLITNVPEKKADAAGGTTCGGVFDTKNGFTVEDCANNIYSFRLCTSATAPCPKDRTFNGCNAGGGATGEQPQVLRSKSTVDSGNFDRWAKGGSGLSGFSQGNTCSAAGGMSGLATVAYDCANNRICVRTSSNVAYDSTQDPRIDSSTWYVGWRSRGILVDNGVKALTISHLHPRHADLILNNQDIGGCIEEDNSNAPTNNITVDHVTADRCGAGISFPASNTTSALTGVTITNCTIVGNYNYGIQFFGGHPSNIETNLLAQGNLIHDNGDHCITNGDVSGVTIDHNVCYNDGGGDSLCGTGFCFGNAQNTASGFTFGTRGGATSNNVTVSNNLIHNIGPYDGSFPGGGNSGGGDITIGNDTGTWNIFNNIGYFSQSGIFYNQSSTAAPNIFNNIFINDHFAELLVSNNNKAVAVVKDNQWIRDANILGGLPAGFAIFQINNTSVLSAWTWDFNDWFHATPACTGSNHNCLFFDGTNYTDTKPAGFDTHGTFCQPAYINESIQNYQVAYTPAPGCTVDMGTSTSPTVTKDIGTPGVGFTAGVTRPQPGGGVYDIGAYEALTSGTTSTSTSSTTSTSTSTSSSSSSSTSTSSSSTSSTTATTSTSTTIAAFTFQLKGVIMQGGSLQ